MADIIQIMAELVSAFVSNNATPAADLPDLMKAVHAALNGTASPAAEEPAPKPIPAVPVRKSVHHDYLVSLEDGKRYQTLKRHLSARGITSDDYRAKWGLPAEYPMVAASYSQARREMSKSLGLGRKKLIESVEAPAAKAHKARSKLTASVEAYAKAPESVQEPAETPPAVEARSNTTAPVEVEARETAPESLVQQPADVQQNAA